MVTKVFMSKNRGLFIMASVTLNTTRMLAERIAAAPTVMRKIFTGDTRAEAVPFIMPNEDTNQLPRPGASAFHLLVMISRTLSTV